MTDKKKTYERPQIEVIEAELTALICASAEGLTEDIFDWGDDTSGSSTESLSEEIFGW